jgi:hypothetical protein
MYEIGVFARLHSSLMPIVDDVVALIDQRLASIESISIRDGDA